MSEVIAVLFVGAMAAGVAIWGIISQRAVTRRMGTLHFIRESEADGDLIKARRKFVELAKAEGGLAPWAVEEREGSEETQSIKIVLNEFELISIGIQRRIVDYELYKRWFRSGVIRHWTHSAPFVTALRARTGNQAIYHEFEEMARWMNANTMPKRRIWFWR